MTYNITRVQIIHVIYIYYTMTLLSLNYIITKLLIFSAAHDLESVLCIIIVGI